MIKACLATRGAFVEMFDPQTSRVMKEFVHGEKQEAIEKWCAEHLTAIARYKGRALWAPAPQEETPASATEASVVNFPAPKASPAPQPVSEVEPVAAADAEEGQVDETANGDGEQIAEPDDDKAVATSEVTIPFDARPCYRVFEKWTYVIEQNCKLHPGVYLFETKKVKDEVVPTLLLLCSPLHVEAITADGNGESYGRVLRFIDAKKKWRHWAMPMELLAGSGEDLRAELYSMGAIPNPNAKPQFIKYLADERPKRQIRCATQVGWCLNSFVLPGEVIGPQKAGIIFQSGERVQAEYGQHGTIEGWQREVSARAIGNPVLMMALSAAFVGPLLEKMEAESGGIHMVGNSSTGKSSVLKAAASVWGGPKHVRSWNSTANGMEGVAALFNDNLLPLDEISECAPRDIDRIIYAIANGVGRQRASRSGAARSVTRWRCFVLSSGERMVPTEMANANIKAKAGQLVRLIDLPVARQHGVWDELHGLPDGQTLSDVIKGGAAKHHGKAGPEFLRQLTSGIRNWSEQLEEFKRLSEFAVSDNDDGQAKRVAARFALIALAGELASEFGVTGWPEGEAIWASAIMFQIWRTKRQHGHAESAQILEQVVGFIDRHGDSRFSQNGDERAAQFVRDRAGWWEDDYDDDRVYWFTPDGLHEATRGHDFNNALDVLIAVGALPERRGDPAVPSRAKNIHGQAKTKRLYPVTYSRLAG